MHFWRGDAVDTSFCLACNFALKRGMPSFEQGEVFRGFFYWVQNVFVGIVFESLSFVFNLGLMKAVWCWTGFV